MRIGGIEAGGTKMVCAIGEVDETGGTGSADSRVKPVQILERISIPTTTPQETLPQMIDFFTDKDIKSLGIGCFGPIDLDKKSASYGYITSTPKLAWRNCDIVGTFSQLLGIPVGFDTDVNAAVFGEILWGAAQGCETAIYITIGTGVGVGVYCNGGLLHGLVHPEAGHILMQRHPLDDYAGRCPYHANCLEGLASGPAIEARWGKPATELTENKEVWELEAYYIAQAVANYILTYSPQKIILWGGVMHQKQLFELVRGQVKELLGGYICHPQVQGELEDYIVAPELGENPGIMGAFGLGLKEII